MTKETREKPEIKVTDKRIFTADGDIREEFRSEIRATEAAAQPVREAAPATAPAAEPPPAEPQPSDRRTNPTGAPRTGERRRTMGDKATSPGTAFSNFIEPLIAQAYISLGMMRNPYQPQATVDPAAARQMIDILSLLSEKTAGNLTPEEDEMLQTHLGQLKLAYVQTTKNIT